MSPSSGARGALGPLEWQLWHCGSRCGRGGDRRDWWSAARPGGEKAAAQSRALMPSPGSEHCSHADPNSTAVPAARARHWRRRPRGRRRRPVLCARGARPGGGGGASGGRAARGARRGADDDLDGDGDDDEAACARSPLCRDARHSLRNCAVVTVVHSALAPYQPAARVAAAAAAAARGHRHDRHVTITVEVQSMLPQLTPTPLLWVCRPPRFRASVRSATASCGVRAGGTSAGWHIPHTDGL